MSYVNSGKKILIAEDEVIIAKEYKMMLEKGGYDPLTPVSHGASAVGSTELLKPDLILMDIKLKGRINGIEAAEKIREEHDIPIVFITGYMDSEEEKRAGKIPNSVYLKKPVMESGLMGKDGIIEKALSGEYE